MVEIKQAQIIITGRVQGVFFRAFAKQQAGKLGLNGYVKNKSDGSLEIVVVGDEKKIKQFSNLCKTGPLMAKVEGLDVAWVFVEGVFEHFDIIY